MPAETSSRTLVLSVVAVDLVGYSRESVAGQMTLKDNFNQVLVRAIQDIAIADRIILDTGDGVAMGFLGDPEDALFVAMFMHDALNRDRPAIQASGREPVRPALKAVTPEAYGESIRCWATLANCQVMQMSEAYWYYGYCFTAA
ncbi:MAG: hypothetical protein LH481_06600 [Burkholderiales bacterium]|nr:hypothetical protein [Burkholderiales bacterium]